MVEEAKKHWEQVELKQPIESDQSKIEDNPKFKEAKKEFLHIINWQINDDKHRKLDQIEETLRYLDLICSNILDHPDEDKYRRIRIMNPKFERFVRNAPGGDAFMVATGFHAEVLNNERFFVFSYSPDDELEWSILKEARNEVQKFHKLVAKKIETSEKSSTFKKKELEERKRAVLAQLEEDKEIRSTRFKYIDNNNTNNNNNTNAES